MEGWQPGILQRAVDTCTSLSGIVDDCQVFDINSDADMAICKFQEPIEARVEAVVGPLKALACAVGYILWSGNASLQR